MDNNQDKSGNSYLYRIKTFINCCDAFAVLYREAGEVIPAIDVKEIYDAIFVEDFIK